MKFMQTFRDADAEQDFHEPIPLKNIFNRINGWIRLWIHGFCPECNSSAPELYDCPVCKWDTNSPFGKEKKEQYWNNWKLNEYKKYNGKKN